MILAKMTMDRPPGGDPTASVLPVPTLSDEEIRTMAENRKRMKSLSHLLHHSPTIPDCPGCMARSKAKKHFRKSFEKDDIKHHNEVTLDQVTMADFSGTLVSVIILTE